MTDFDPTSDEFGAAYLDPDDELVSAYVDDEASADERARVEASPELMARVDDYRSTSGAIADSVRFPTETARDEMVTNALAAWADQRLEAAGIEDTNRDGTVLETQGDDAQAGVTSPPSARQGTPQTPSQDSARTNVPVADLAAARKRRDRARVMLGAVAAAVLLIVAVPLIGRLDFGGGGTDASSDVASSAADSSDAGGGDANDSAAAPATTSVVEAAIEAEEASSDADDEMAEEDRRTDESELADEAAAPDDDGDTDDESAGNATTAAAPATTPASETTTSRIQTQTQGDSDSAASTVQTERVIEIGGVPNARVAIEQTLEEIETGIVTTPEKTDNDDGVPAGVDNFLALCALELDEPDIVATALLPGGERIYIVRSPVLPDDPTGSNLIAVNETCTTVDVGP